MAQGSAVVSSVPDEEPALEEVDEFEDRFSDEDGGDREALRTAEIEARARRQGWRPIDEYRGEPGKWVDAEAFLDRGTNFLPFVQKQAREASERAERMEGEIGALRTELADSRQVLQELRKHALNANQAGYERARREIEAEMRSAVSEGNLEGFDAAKEKMEALQEGRREAEEPPPPPPPAAPKPTPAVKIDPAIEQFLAENPWFNADPQLNAAMQGYHMTLKASKPGLSLAQNFAEAKRRVMQDFPDKFADEIEEDELPAPQPRRPASPLAPSQGGRQLRQRGKGFDSIPDAAEREAARTAYARVKRHDPEITVEDYLTLLDNPRADVLEMRAQKKRKQ